MADAPRKTEWRVIARSVLGASHVRSGLPNQDAIGSKPALGHGSAVSLVVSDGHSQVSCFRSHVGSALAVKVGLETTEPLLQRQAELDLSAVKRIGEVDLAPQIVKRWRSEVEAHLKSNPFTPEELKALEADATPSGGPKGVARVQAKPHLAYGATLVCVVVTDSYLLCLQIGDGDIVTVSETGETAWPLAKDPELVASETYSLCHDDPLKHLRFGFQALHGSVPALIMASTDGYSDSYPADSDFLKVASDYLNLIRTDGVDSVGGRLEPWLAAVSQKGSGDDISVGLIKRMEEKDLDTLLQNIYGARADSAEARVRSAEAKTEVAELRKSVDAMGTQLKAVEAKLGAAPAPAMPAPAPLAAGSPSWMQQILVFGAGLAVGGLIAGLITLVSRIPGVGLWVLGTLLVLAGAGAGGYVWWRRRRPVHAAPKRVEVWGDEPRKSEVKRA